MATRSGIVALAGATGYIGRAVAIELVGRGYTVIALVRSLLDAEDALGGCDVRVVDFAETGALTSTLAGVDAVISCMASRSGEPADAWRVDYEANSSLLSASRKAGASQFVLLSAICVQKPALEFQRAKLAFEKELIASGLTYSIVRPTAFFKSLSGQVERVLAGKPFVVFGDGTQTACKPISEADLARYIVDCLDKAELQDQVLPIGGPGAALTPKEQGSMLFELAGKTPRFRYVSPRIFSVAIALLSPFAGLSTKIAAKSELARIGRYYATESMLAWDEDAGHYDADATPTTGSDTLRDHYARMLREGTKGQELGEHKLF